MTRRSMRGRTTRPGATGRRPIAVAAGVAGLIAVVLVALGACGVPLDTEPRAVTRTTVTTTTFRTATTSDNPEAAQLDVFFVRDDALEPVQYPVDGDPTIDEAIGYLLEGPPEDRAEVNTRIPTGTTLLGAIDIDDGVATVDLSAEINDVNGLPEKQAFAQLVFTTLAFDDGIDAVRFEVEGTTVSAPTDDGNRETVRAGNYDPPLNPG